LLLVVLSTFSKSKIFPIFLLIPKPFFCRKIHDYLSYLWNSILLQCEYHQAKLRGTISIFSFTNVGFSKFLSNQPKYCLVEKLLKPFQKFSSNSTGEMMVVKKRLSYFRVLEYHCLMLKQPHERGRPWILAHVLMLVLLLVNLLAVRLGTLPSKVKWMRVILIQRILSDAKLQKS
jgi:hypothetical protein